ncbi:MAG: 50S ribosomal protein L22 [Patescibacteria group bacterium]|nr:50S ribosomal protein L22 [Patescibacteria group bacterium]
MANATTKTESTKLVKASARDLRIAPRKMRLVTNLLKGLSVNDAMIQLQYLEKKGAPMVAKLLQSAVANAKNNFSMDPDHLFIKSITADMGRAMKRYFPRARGSAFVIRRKMTHVNVVLEERKQASKRKFNLFKKETQPETANVDQQKAVSAKPPKELGRKSEVVKSEEQVKLNKVQNKRRLFNRKSGE